MDEHLNPKPTKMIPSHVRIAVAHPAPTEDDPHPIPVYQKMTMDEARQWTIDRQQNGDSNHA